MSVSDEAASSLPQPETPMLKPWFKRRSDGSTEGLFFWDGEQWLRYDRENLTRINELAKGLLADWHVPIA